MLGCILEMQLWIKGFRSILVIRRFQTPARVRVNRAVHELLEVTLSVVTMSTSTKADDYSVVIDFTSTR